VLQYLAGRLAQAAGALLAISLFCFALVRLAPGDPAYLILAQSGTEPTPEAVAQRRAELGLDQPLPVQYRLWLERLAHLDLGRSFRTRQPISEELLARLPATLSLGLAGWLLGVGLALPLGLAAAAHANGWIDRVGRIVAVLGASLPSFWLGLLLLYLFAVQLRWLPAMGTGDVRHLLLPALTLAVGVAAPYSRLLRATLLEVLGSDAIRTARAKGLPERQVLWGHAFRQALPPLLTLTGLALSQLWGGTAIVETVFGWPGIGKFVVDSIALRDYQAIQGFVLLMAITVLSGNLLVDLAYRWVDPRIRLPGESAHAR
jgi:peptide/nickel transport system permease protein